MVILNSQFTQVLERTYLVSTIKWESLTVIPQRVKQKKLTSDRQDRLKKAHTHLHNSSNKQEDMR